MICTVYTTTTGVIRHVIDSPDLATVMLNVGTGEAVVEGFNEATQVYMTWEGPQPYPEKPGDWAVWDGAEWTDPRSPADLEAELQARRDAARMDKADLLLALTQVGLLTSADAVAAARGEIPPSFQPVVAAWPAAEQLAARIKWAADGQISRNNPLILAVASFLEIDPLTLDTIFDVGNV